MKLNFLSEIITVSHWPFCWKNTYERFFGAPSEIVHSNSFGLNFDFLPPSSGAASSSASSPPSAFLTFATASTSFSKTGSAIFLSYSELLIFIKTTAGPIRFSISLSSSAALG